MSVIWKFFSNARSTRHRLATVATLSGILVALFGAGETLAQTSERIAKAPARVAYQAYLKAECLQGGNFCRFNAENVPADRVLEIHRVACQGWVTTAQTPSFVAIVLQYDSADEYVARIDFLKTSATHLSWGTNWSISEQTLMFIPAGHRLQITLNSGVVGLGSYGCTISGYLTRA